MYVIIHNLSLDTSKMEFEQTHEANPSSISVTGVGPVINDESSEVENLDDETSSLATDGNDLIDDILVNPTTTVDPATTADTTDTGLTRDANIDWKPYYNLSKASLGQIVQTLSKIKFSRRNVYEKALAEELEIIIPNFISSFDAMLDCVTKEEIDVYKVNLLGNLPKSVMINPEDHAGILLHRAPIGQIISALKQRVEFILERDTPVMYDENKTYLEAFEEMKNKLKNFNEEILQFESKFCEAIKKAHDEQRKKSKHKNSYNQSKGGKNYGNGYGDGHDRSHSHGNGNSSFKIVYVTQNTPTKKRTRNFKKVSQQD